MRKTELSTRMLRSQLEFFKPFVDGCGLETTRRGQDALGQLMGFTHKNEVEAEDITLDGFDCAMIKPKDRLTGGVILYLHGGGYTCGDLSYARGYGTVLSAKCGIDVFCAAYRLAPESVFPAALDDSYTAWCFLLSRGYRPQDIVLFGESAGGGLIYALCLKLKTLGEAMPAGIIGVSPWTDLTLSGSSYERNRDADPSLTKERLRFFADSYVYGEMSPETDENTDRTRKSDPFMSPLFGVLNGLPPSLLFVGGDEILLEDTLQLHSRLLAAGCRSQLVVTEGMWHAYVLYSLKEYESDYERINTFIRMVMPREEKLRWMRLDNAAKIYPAAMRRNWSNLFRLSAVLSEPVDVPTLRSALDVTVRRFPSMSVRLRRGVFWYYLEEIPKAPAIMEEKPYPLARMPLDDIRKCAFRVIVYKSRVAVEFFHALTDGNGGLIFLKTLLAEYLTEKYGLKIPAENGVLNRLERPDEAELEDSFLKYSGAVSAGRSEPTAYHVEGDYETDGFRTVTTLMMDANAVNAKAKSYGVTVTAFLTAAAMQALISLQNEDVPVKRRRKQVRVLLPVNLRKLFDSRTLRNFVLYVTPGIDPRLGEYSFEEIAKSVWHQMCVEVTAKQMSARIAANVGSERAFLLKIAPLFIKNAVMKAVFDAIGERKSCLSLSNLGIIKLPEEMLPYVSRMDMILGVQASAPYNCGVVTFGDTMYMNFIRNIREPRLESRIYEVLREQGIHVTAESNQRNGSC